MDLDLRNGLWSSLKLHVWDHVEVTQGIYSSYFISATSNPETFRLCQRLWLDYFKKPLDELDTDWLKVHEQLREGYFRATWNEVYDFVEFVANNYQRRGFHEEFTASCNVLLQREVSAFRFVDGLLTKNIEPGQIEEIELAIAGPNELVRTHLRRALELLSSRDAPDYRNSMKESISAVESLVAASLGEKGTLGQMLKRLEDEAGLHPALKEALSKLYGYTNDESGIRHALTESGSPGLEEAKFLLVVCSAFINLLGAKGISSGG